MIYVNVKTSDELLRVVKYATGNNNIEIDTDMKNYYSSETVIKINPEKDDFMYADIEFYAGQGFKIISFEEFEQQYLNGTATQDIVNHPNHYNSYSREVIDTMQGSMTPEEFKGYLKGNVMKYINRYQFKNGVEDLKKAQWYLNKLTEVVDDEI